MPTTDKVPIFEFGHAPSIDPGYQAGYADGLQEGERRGWEAGKEAAAELAKQSQGRLTSGAIAAAIRKLKKP